MQWWDFNLRHLRAVVEIDRRGSVTAAADAVNLSQPAITQALVRLEAALGQPMFDRHAGGMAANPAGRLLAARAETALDHIASKRVTMAHLRALLSLADAGSYPMASAATGLSQPSLHRAVADLALAVRQSITERRGKGLVLTDAGRRIVRRFRLAQAELRAALYELEGQRGRECGRIVVGAMPLARSRILPAAIMAFHRRHPAVEVAVVEGSWSELVEPLRDGQIDVMIGALRGESPGLDLIQRPLFDDQPVIIGRTDHPFGRTPASASLADYPWIVPGPGTPLRMLWDRMFSDAGILPPPVIIECGSVIMIRQMLIDSDLLTLLSADQVAVELGAGLLAKMGDAPGNLARTIGITTRSGWRPTSVHSTFIDEIVGASTE